MRKTIVFDMDGTLYDLEGVPNWLQRIRAEDNTAYYVGKPLVNVAEFNKACDNLRSVGYGIEIVTWGGKGSTDSFLAKTKIAKMMWLARTKLTYDKIHVIHYGTPKGSVYDNKTLIREGHHAILFDDNDQVRQNWRGTSHTEKDLVSKLKRIYQDEIKVKTALELQAL